MSSCSSPCSLLRNVRSASALPLPPSVPTGRPSFIAPALRGGASLLTPERSVDIERHGLARVQRPAVGVAAAPAVFHALGEQLLQLGEARRVPGGQDHLARRRHPQAAEAFALG